MIAKRRIGAGAAVIGTLAMVAFGAATTAVAAAAPCTGAMLSSTFKLEPGSQGAGNIVYRLRVRNISKGSCFVTGIPSLHLLGAAGAALPTHAVYGGPKGALSSVMVQLAPGASAQLSARFSPDVAGTGETQTGACEKTAHEVRVGPSGGGTTIAPITPPTPVCEHGRMLLTVFTH